MKKVICCTFVTLLIMSFGCSNPAIIRNTEELNKRVASATVTVVRPDERSGGTGVILRSAPSRSDILTNNHVCELIKNGGVVITDDDRKHAVIDYKQSTDHDLCLIGVNEDLHVVTQVAEKAPEKYSEAIVSGHPTLLPTIITYGHFSAKRLVQIMIGSRACTQEELEGPNGLICILLGGVPVVKSFEAQVVSATIQPGSSGSAVYNSDGELSGLVFAGSGDLGYGLIVPYEYVYNFLYKESKHIEAKVPNTMINVDFNRAPASSVSPKDRCRPIKNEVLRELCVLAASGYLEIEVTL